MKNTRLLCLRLWIWAIQTYFRLKGTKERLDSGADCVLYSTESIYVFQAKHYVAAKDVNLLQPFHETFRYSPARLKWNLNRAMHQAEPATEPKSVLPPVNAEFLFYLFLDSKLCDALVGDLEERYQLIHEKFGARRANLWYWVQVMTSVGPIAWAATKKLLKAVSGVAALVEMWRRIRG